MGKRIVWVLCAGLCAVGVSACGGGSGADPVTAKAAVETAGEQCGAQTAVGDDAARYTQCLSESLVAQCGDDGAACDDAAEMAPPLTQLISQFCLLDTAVNGILPKAVDCVRSGFAWGCGGLAAVLHTGPLTECLTEQFSVFCSLPGSDRLAACAGGSVTAAMSPDARMALLTPIGEAFQTFCPPGSDSACVEARFASLCGAGASAFPFCVATRDNPLIDIPTAILAQLLCTIPAIRPLLADSCD